MVSSITRSVASGSTAVFSVPFPYLDKAHLQVRLNGILKARGTDYSFLTDSTIQISAGNPTAGTVVERRRSTPTDPLTTFQPGNLDSGDLNVAELQPLYVAQESFDLATDFLARAWIGANNALGGTVTRGGAGHVLAFDVDGNIVDGGTSAGALLDAAQQAQDARDQTLAAFDSFDDRYLGPKAADPPTDNDGSALISGTLYFNTTTGNMMVFNGAAWVAAYVSGTDYPLKSLNGSDYTAATFRTNLSLYSKAEVDGFAVKLTGAQPIAGVKTFSSAPVVPAGSWGYASIASGAIASNSEFQLGTASKLLTAAILKSTVAYQTLTDATTIVWDMSLGNNALVVLAGNRTLGNPSNANPQFGFVLKVTATTATRTLDKGANWVIATGVEAFPISIATTETVFIVGFVDASSRIVVTGVVRT